VDRTALEQLSQADLIALLLAQEARHAAEMSAMQARIAELEGRLGLNSSNSGKPESIRISGVPWDGWAGRR
jgi:hypothetical protein